MDDDDAYDVLLFRLIDRLELFPLLSLPTIKFLSFEKALKNIIE